MIVLSRLLGIACLLALLAPSAPTGAAPQLWRVDEFLVASPATNQFAPAVSGAIVVWSDQRNGGAVIRVRNLLSGVEFDVAAGRVDPLAVRDTKLAPALSGNIAVWQNRGVSADGTNFDRIYGRDL